MKTVKRINESQLNSIVRKAVKRALMEMDSTAPGWKGYWYEIDDQYGQGDPSDTYPTIEDALAAGISDAKSCRDNDLPANVVIGYWITDKDGNHCGEYTGDGVGVNKIGKVTEKLFYF